MAAAAVVIVVAAAVVASVVTSCFDQGGASRQSHYLLPINLREVAMPPVMSRRVARIVLSQRLNREAKEGSRHESGTPTVSGMQSHMEERTA